MIKGKKYSSELSKKEVVKLFKILNRSESRVYLSPFDAGKSWYYSIDVHGMIYSTMFRKMLECGLLDRLSMVAYGDVITIHF